VRWRIADSIVAQQADSLGPDRELGDRVACLAFDRVGRQTHRGAGDRAAIAVGARIASTRRKFEKPTKSEHEAIGRRFVDFIGVPICSIRPRSSRRRDRTSSAPLS
jgi:hypothetical protein